MTKSTDQRSSALYRERDALASRVLDGRATRAEKTRLAFVRRQIDDLETRLKEAPPPRSPAADAFRASYLETIDKHHPGADDEEIAEAMGDDLPFP